MKRPRNLFLSLGIACFMGIVAIFVFAGYLGTYDTVYVTTGEYEQVIEPEFWLNQEQGRSPYSYSVGARWGEPVAFRYEIDNRRPSDYTASVDVSLWQGNRKLLDLLNQNVAIRGFSKATLGWTLAPATFQKAGLEIGQYTVKIKRGGAELGQGIIIGFNQAMPGTPPQPVPALR